MKLGCMKGLSLLKAMAATVIEHCHLFLLCQGMILCITGYGLGLTTLSVQPAEARQGAKQSHNSHHGNNKRHTHWGHALPTGPATNGNKVEQVKVYPMPCRISRIHSMMLSKKKRAVNWQETTHGWAMQNSESSCVQPRRAPESKRLAKTISWAQPYFETAARRIYPHTAVNG